MRAQLVNSSISLHTLGLQLNTQHQLPYFTTPFEDLKNLSKAVLSLLGQYLGKGYCLTLDNYYTSPEVAKCLLLNSTDCYGTLRKKEKLPHDFWNWKPDRGDPPMKKFEGDVAVMRWNDLTKTKKVKIVSMMSTIHTFELFDSNKRNRQTGEIIQKPDVILDYNKTMGGVDLVSRVLIPYTSQRRGIKWYRKLAELFLDICVYNSFILWKKLNPGRKGVDHFAYRKILVEEILMYHSSIATSYSYRTGPNRNHLNENLTRLTGRHFPRKVPATAKKERPQRRCIRCSRRGTRRDSRYYCATCDVGLCHDGEPNDCFEVYHTQRDFTRDFNVDPEASGESEPESEQD